MNAPWLLISCRRTGTYTCAHIKHIYRDLKARKSVVSRVSLQSLLASMGGMDVDEYADLLAVVQFGYRRFLVSDTCP